MSGTYLVEGAYLSDSRGAGLDVTEAAGENSPSDAYFMHTFEIRPTMKVNDKITMAANIRVADDTFWGGQAGGDLTSNSTTTAGTHNDFYVHHLYMDYASPIGKMRFGRTPAGPYGTSYLDPDSRGDRVMLWPSFLASGPVSTLFFIQKITDAARDLTAPDATHQSDEDSTKYVGRVYYKTANLDSGLSYEVTDNQVTNTADDVKQAVIVYGKYKMDNFFANGEVQHFFGSKDYDHALVATADQDYDSWAAMLQVGAKFDALTPSLMYFYAQGQEMNENDIENHLGTAGTGDLFEPLYILTGRHTGMLNNDIYSGGVGSNMRNMSAAGIHAVVAAADYAVSNQLSLHGAIAWAQADEEQVVGQDDEYGWEYNIGAAYKLLDNLTYEAHFGYLDTGDFFKSTPTTDDTENVYILTHHLTMTF
ncbi:MAG: hypothetical protein D9V46_06445 [Deltaproteobacteria bacterium]|uniref:porin n=1 Tax=Hydrosulfovibrio ferrireducens TaxID=2934181 RepID=UPI0011F52073|nr:MAG: hypothetical protein D9V46_06445 [Deltaproteobacteria bacterium]